MSDATYLGIPHEQLRFVRVIQGIEGFSANENGDLSIKLLEEANPDGRRNTTHGTLNAVVSNVIGGTFSESKFGIVANFMDVAKANELISMQPADTYFWNKDNGIQIPKATLFAPDNAELPKDITERVNVIKYQHGSTDAECFKHMNQAIKKHFHENKLPFYGVDGHGWVERPWHQAGVDHSGKDTEKVSEILGYKVEKGQHDGTPHESVENAIALLKAVEHDFNNINSKEDYEKANSYSLNQGGRTLKHDFDIAYYGFNDALKAMPSHHKDFYLDKFRDQFLKFELQMNERINGWYPPEQDAALNLVGAEKEVVSNKIKEIPHGFPSPTPNYNGPKPPPLPQNDIGLGFEGSDQSLVMLPPQAIYTGAMPPPIPHAIYTGAMPPPVPQPIYTGTTPPPPPLPQNMSSDAEMSKNNTFMRNYAAGIAGMGVTPNLIQEKQELESLAVTADETLDQLKVQLAEHGLDSDLSLGELNNRIDLKNDDAYGELAKDPKISMYLSNANDAYSDYYEGVNDHIQKVEFKYITQNSADPSDQQILNKSTEGHLTRLKANDMPMNDLNSNLDRFSSSINTKNSNTLNKQPKKEQTHSYEF